MWLLSRPESDALDPEFWRDRFREHVIVRQSNGGYNRNEAEHLAWGEMKNR
jgi:hypothetical protein